MDIKKSNIIWIIKEKENFFPDLCLIDFNLSRNIDDNKRKKNRGNQKYASINVLLGNKINKKGHLISLCYLLLELINGYLPWSKLKYKTQNEKKEQIIKKKQNFNLYKFIKKETAEIGAIYNLINKLKDEEKSEYNLYQKLLIDMKNKNLKKMNLENIGLYGKQLLKIK